MNEKELTELAGTVAAVIFHNEENGYTVLRLDTGSGDNVTVTGCLPFAAPGERLILQGSWQRHPTHGEQFAAETAQRFAPSGKQAVYAYLASRVIKGIGPATASLLVAQFGEKALQVLENEPEKAGTVKGIGMARAREISRELRKQAGLRHLMEYLGAYQIKLVYVMRLYRYYGDKARDLVRENPYVISLPHIGGDFAEADALALAQGFDGDSAERVAAAILFELQYNSGRGHVFIPKEKLLAATSQLIDVEVDTVEEGYGYLLDSGEIVCQAVAGCEAVYLASLYESESFAAERLAAMLRSRPKGKPDLDAVIAEVERKQGIQYAPMQRQTLALAAENRVVLLTGGPGTGKTTSVRAIIAMFEAMGLKVQLAAPTGRAAKRMSELTGREASTVHRLLGAGYAPDGFDLVFSRDEDDPLECEALILDECSMVDIQLMSSLLAALPKDCRLVLVGDADQLPSVGPGNVFLDLLRSNAVPTVRLTDIFRQKADSRIVRSAHLINEGRLPDLRENKGDFFFLRRPDPETAAALVVQLCAERLPRNMGLPVEDIQVLTPTRKGPCGSVELNLRLQRALNPADEKKKERKFGDIVFRVGDRVMQIRNDYDLIWKSPETLRSGTGVFNGDIGYITAIDAAKENLTVNYDGRYADYGFDMLSELEHAWAMTVHKSQGSEYRAVVLCLCGAPQALQYRGVLYTAVTRARELLVCTGDDQTVRRMTENHRQARRYSGLRSRLAGGAAEGAT